MAEKKFTLDLAKLIIAAAWADRELNEHEINSLKDILFTLEDIDNEDWKVMNIYIDSPVSKDELQGLLENVLDNIKTDGDKQMVVDTMQKLFTADESTTDDENQLLEQLTQAVFAVDTSLVAKISNSIKSIIGKRENKYNAGTQREEMLDDFLKNTIYYQLKLDGQVKIDMSDENIRQLCFAGGLLSRVAFVDGILEEDELNAIKVILMKLWHVSEEQADIITRISCHRTVKGLDYYRLTRGFVECTTYAQRKVFITCLFQIANASEKTSHYETEEIKHIADSLKLSHNDFIQAKCTISDEDLGLK